jgi:asparagine synthase (glutamine-hydrolysing)
VSGIVGLFHRGGRPVDRTLVETLTRFLAFRGPDGCDTWWNGPVGFGHTLLRTTRDGPIEIQPAALEGRYWITADVRLDRRIELAAKLRTAGRPTVP